MKNETGKTINIYFVKMQKPGGRVLVIGRRRPQPREGESVDSSSQNSEVTSFVSHPWLKDHISSVLKVS